MNGTQKQIEWATEIKETYDAALTQLLAMPMPTEPTPAQAELITKLKAISDVTDASWWIDNREFVSPADAKGLATATAVNLSKGDFALPTS